MAKEIDAPKPRPSDRIWTGSIVIDCTHVERMIAFGSAASTTCPATPRVRRE